MNNTEQFLSKHPKYREDLEKILKYEKEHKEKWEEAKHKADESNLPCISGFEWSEAKVNPSHLNTMLLGNIVDQVYNSRSSTIYRLENPEEVEETLSKTIEEVGKVEEFLHDVTVTDEDIKEFTEILNENDGLDYWYPFICPKIVEADRQKQAMLLALASHWDEHGDRMRIHILMYGKESSGTAKTPLLMWIKDIGGGYVGMRATKAGITVNLQNGSPGFLPNHHHNVVSLDEMDKIDKADRDGILQSMEEGVISFESAEAKGEYPAETIVIGAANDIKCFSPEQLKRFDFRFELKQYNIKQAQNIAEEISYFIGKPKEKETMKLKKFLKWIRGQRVNISDEVRKKGAKLVQEYIEYSKNTDIRHIMSIWRVARSIAGLNHQDSVSIDNVKRAIKILNNVK